MRLAQTPGIFNPAIGTYGGGPGADGAVLLAKLIAQALSVTFIVGGILLLAMTLFAGFEFMTAGGNKEKTASAQKRLGTMVVGFILLVAARAIVGYIADVLGVDWLKTLKIVWPKP